MLKRIAVLIAGIILIFGFIFSVYAAESVSGKDSAAGVKRTMPEELKSLIDKGTTVLIVDVRSENAYKQRHITGAMSVPLNNVEATLSPLPPETKIVFY